MPVGNLGNSWEFHLGLSQPGIGLEFVKCLQSGKGKVANFDSENSREPNMCSFGLGNGCR